jgi:hypothetical protein
MKKFFFLIIILMSLVSQAQDRHGRTNIVGYSEDGVLRIGPDHFGGERSIGFFKDPECINKEFRWVLGANDWSVGDNFGLGFGHSVLYVFGTNGTATATGWNSTSDARFKTEIRPLENPLEKILKLQGVSFEWNRKKFPERNFQPGQQIGFIAQAVEKQFPEIVSTDEQGYKSIDYSKLTTVLVECIKIQQAQIGELKSQVDALRAELGSIRISTREQTTAQRNPDKH